MFEMWKGVTWSFLLQLLAGLLVYDWTGGSTKYFWVAMTTVAALGGLIVWGYAEADDIGRTLLAAVFVIIALFCGTIVIAGVSYDWIWGPAGKWMTLVLMLASWMIPPLLVKSAGETAPMWMLILVATPFGLGLLVGAAYYLCRVLTGTIRYRGKYRRAFL